MSEPKVNNPKISSSKIAKTVPSKGACDIPMQWKKEGIANSLMAVGGKGKFLVPDMPDVVIQLEKEVHSRYPNIRNVVDIISSNTVIAGEILNIVKTPAYTRHVHGAIEIKSITHVVNLIGLKRTFELALAAAIKSFPQKSTLFRSIIDFSADVALGCAEIAGYVYGVEIEDAYLFGLFKEGGAIGLAATLDEAYEKSWERIMSFPETGVDLEFDTINARHDYLGVAAARQWGFGKTEVELEMLYAIQEHHNHEEMHRFANERARLLVAIGLLADALVCEINAENYLANEAISVKEKAIDVLMLSDNIVSLIRSNLISALVTKG